jgi:hypothetical protein
MTGLEKFDIAIKLIGIASLVFTAISLWQTSKYQRRQWNFNAFTHYTKRYDEIMGSFPEATYLLRFDLNQAIQSNEEVRLSVLKYLNMTSEEYYLWRDKYLGDKVWKIWLPEIKRTLRTPLFQREWQNLKEEFRSYPEFSSFVEQVQSDMLLSIRPQRPRR